jgi:hypothetical protein
VHKLRDLDWQRLEQIYETKAMPKADAPPASVDVRVDRRGFPILPANVGNQ